MATEVREERATSLQHRAAAALAAREAQLAQEERESNERARNENRDQIQKYLAHVLDIMECTIVDDGPFVNQDDEYPSAIAEASGLTFQVRDGRLCVRRPCSTCDGFVWLYVGTWHASDALASLGAALRYDDTSRHCRLCYRKRLDAPKPETPATTEPTMGTALLELEQAGEKLATATDRELELQSLRGIRKDQAVRRIMEAKGLAATPAEKIVEEDAEYAAFLKEARGAVADRIRAETAYASAKIRAQLQAKLAAVRGEES